MSVSTDRTVHGQTWDGEKIVRYDRGGKWYVEKKDGTRKRVGVKEAASLAAMGDAYLGKPGGGAFDFKVVTALKKAKA